MTPTIRNLIFSLIFAGLLSALYVTEILDFWQYMGFHGSFSLLGLALTLVSTATLAIFTPQTKDVRGIILTSLSYLYFIPSFVYMYFSDSSIVHIGGTLFLIISLYTLSSLNLDVVNFKPISPRNLMILVLGLAVVAIFVQAWFGGLRNFSLDINRVYEFREESSDSMPPIFMYFYSNISTILLPIILVLAINYRSKIIIAAAIACIIVLFGMTHHKSVLFAPFLAAALYAPLHKAKNSSNIGVLFVVVAAACLIEVAYIRFIEEQYFPSYLTAISARRIFFVPPLLDELYIEYFNGHAKYFWSTSRLGSWASTNSYGVSAPVLIGDEFFGGTNTYANSGAIGSGFANAGFYGIMLYSILAGLLLGVLNSYGKRIGHAFVAVASLILFFNIVAAADFTSVLLTHGLLLLLLLLAFFPRRQATGLA